VKHLMPLAVLIWLLMVHPLLADELSGRPVRSISGQGVVVVKRNPTTMRVTIQLNESGKTLPEALNNLKDRRELAITQLEKLGARREAMLIGEPSIPADDPNKARMMAALAMSNARGGLRKTKGPTTPTSVAAQSFIGAEWKLPSGSLEEMLLIVKPLQDKIAAADLAGLNEKKKQTPQEEELSEEMQMMQQAYQNPNETKPGEPRYFFIAELSAEERQKATAAAFEKARKNAERLATAAGLKLGKLQSIHSGADPNMAMTQAMQWSMMRGDDSATETFQGTDPLEFDVESTGRAQAPRCGPVSFSFTVAVAFEPE
jgi:uncharacterized protein YggE